MGVCVCLSEGGGGVHTPHGSQHLKNDRGNFLHQNTSYVMLHYIFTPHVDELYTISTKDPQTGMSSSFSCPHTTYLPSIREYDIGLLDQRKYSCLTLF